MVTSTPITDKTLRIRSVRHLAWSLETSPDALELLAEEAPGYYRSFEREVKGKKRLLVESTGHLKRIQRRILDNILMRLSPFPTSFGAAKGKTIKDNAKVHAASRYIAKLDIRSFYPSIHSIKVYRFFISQECSPDVARLLTALTTRDYALPLGTSTSPALADHIVRQIDLRIHGMAAKVSLNYTRYVDDITLSGPFPLERFSRMAVKILNQAGFRVKKSKLAFYGPTDASSERVITGVAIRSGRITAPIDYVKSLEEELREAIRESHREVVEGDFCPKEHYRGKINYIKWLDPERGLRLLKMYHKVDWRRLQPIMAKQPRS
jgi:RNA-directed DNA polymerase